MRVRFGTNENQRLHTFRHVFDAGLDVELVQEMIETDLRRVSLLGGLNKIKLEGSGIALMYHAFQLPDGDINVGRITIIGESSFDATVAKR